MTNVICPKCHSVVPPWQSCLNCYTSLAGRPGGVTESGKSSTDTPQTARLGQSPSSSADTAVKARRPAPFGIIGSMASQIDPNLFRCIQRREQGFRKLPSASQPEDQLGVIARLTDIEPFEKIDGVKIATRIEPTEKDNTWIVTALVPWSNFEDIRQQEFVVSMKASQRIRPSLEKTIQEIGARRTNPPNEPLANGGSGVIVGIVDFGMDFMHRNFRAPGVDGGSRILALWDQTAAPDQDSPAPFGYGKVHTKEAIDAALGQNGEDPYEFLGYGPPTDGMFVTGAHGTYVADVAAGNGEGTGAPGVAPNSDIVFVEISTKGIPSSHADVVGNTFGETKQLLDAVEFIFDFAAKRDRPCVVNLSLGTNGGPHDGKTLVELAIDRLVEEAPNRAVVIAASNLAGKNLHATGQVSADMNNPVELKWHIFPNDTTINELEIWYSKNDRFDVEVVKPNGLTKVAVEFREKASFSVGEKSTMVVVNREDDPNNEDNTINVFFEQEIAPGIWTLRLRGASIADGGGRFNAWIERDETGPSRFEPSATCNINDDCTLGSIACGEKSIVVGGYDAHKAGFPLCEFTSSGPTRDGRPKPEISAPGQDVFAAHSRTLVERHSESGTSMSAPAVTGVVALMLAEAMTNKISLDIDKIREILIQTARPDPPVFGNADTNMTWNPQYGHGRVSAAAAVAAVSALIRPNAVPQGAGLAAGRNREP